MTAERSPRAILRTAREAILSRPVIFLLIVALGGALDVLFHMAVGDLMPRPPEFGALVNRFGFAPVVMAWIAMAFVGMGLTFLFWARRMGGSGLAKGLRYGLAIGVMIQVAMFEGVGLLGTPVIAELVMGLADAVPIFLMILLLGWWLAPHSPPAAPAAVSAGLWALLPFALIYGGGRLLAQLLGIIESGLDDGPVATILWSFAMGAVIGLAWMMLADLRRGFPGVGGALAFGLGVYGVNWALFMTFVPMVFPDALADTALRVGIDILLVTGAALLAGSREAAARQADG